MPTVSVGPLSGVGVGVINILFDQLPDGEVPAGNTTVLVVRVMPLPSVPRFPIKKLFVPPGPNGAHGPLAVPLLTKVTVVGALRKLVVSVMVNTPGEPKPAPVMLLV